MSSGITKKLKWAFKTITGYKVSVFTNNVTYDIEHRPFRQPKTEKKPIVALRGRKFTSLYIDEYVGKEQL